VIGLAGGFALFEAAEHGGEVVYAYAGGVGIRSGNPEDVDRLMVAALYHQARRERAAGRVEEAARLTEELARRLPADPDAQLLAVQSLIEDRKDGRAALAALDAMAVPDTLPRLVVRVGLLRVDAYTVLGLGDSARHTLNALAERFPQSAAVRARVEAAP
jgi:predicted Zn-dependent protease